MTLAGSALFGLVVGTVAVSFASTIGATLAMTHRLGLKHIAATIHPYPTQAEAIRQVADAYNRTRLTPLPKALFSRLMAWRR